MHAFLIDRLECPVCHGQLDWRIDQQSNHQIEQAQAQCSDCEAVFAIQDGIGIFLTPDLPRKDLWEQVDSQLTMHIKNHPQHERQLMGVTLEDLSPTDQLYRAMMLEARGDLLDARKAEGLANLGLYAPDHLACWNSQIDFVVSKLAAFESPVVDLASGRCYLVEKIASQLRRPVVATDFSPAVLRRDRKLFQLLGLDELVSLLAFDARRTPFRNDCIEIMTTNLGLPNIEEPGRLLHELRRVVDGTMLAISHFFPPEDKANREAIQQVGLDALLYRESALEHFISAGWKVELENVCMADAFPTPPSNIIEGARADGLPVSPTVLEWCVLRATS